MVAYLAAPPLESSQVNLSLLYILGHLQDQVRQEGVAVGTSVCPFVMTSYLAPTMF